MESQSGREPHHMASDNLEKQQAQQVAGRCHIHMHCLSNHPGARKKQFTQPQPLQALDMPLKMHASKRRVLLHTHTSPQHTPAHSLLAVTLTEPIAA